MALLDKVKKIIQEEFGDDVEFLKRAGYLSDIILVDPSVQLSTNLRHSLTTLERSRLVLSGIIRNRLEEAIDKFECKSQPIAYVGGRIRFGSDTFSVEKDQENIDSCTVHFSGPIMPSKKRSFTEYARSVSVNRMRTYIEDIEISPYNFPLLAFLGIDREITRVDQDTIRDVEQLRKEYSLGI